MAKRFTAIVVLLALSFMSFAAMGTTQCAWAEDVAQAEETTLININTALVDELATLKGIGEKTAQAIVAYREANGPFSAVEDLMNVKGVGEKKYAAIKDHLTVGKTN